MIKYISPFNLFIWFLGGIIGNNDNNSIPSINITISRLDIAIGNIIGSNIFNMLLIIGVSAFINPILYNTSYNLERYLLYQTVHLFFP